MWCEMIGAAISVEWTYRCDSIWIVVCLCISFWELSHKSVREPSESSKFVHLLRYSGRLQHWLCEGAYNRPFKRRNVQKKAQCKLPGRCKQPIQSEITCARLTELSLPLTPKRKHNKFHNILSIWHRWPQRKHINYSCHPTDWAEQCDI